MEKFDKAFEAVIKYEGNNYRQDNEDSNVLLCSDCFQMKD